MCSGECPSRADNRVDLFIVYQQYEGSVWNDPDATPIIEAFFTQIEVERKCADMLREGESAIKWQKCTIYIEDKVLLEMIKCQIERQGLKESRSGKTV